MIQLWNNFSKDKLAGNYIDKVLGLYKAEQIMKFISNRIERPYSKLILKTDLAEEALGNDQILFLDYFNSAKVIGIDIAVNIVSKAIKNNQSTDKQNYLSADVTRLPFKDNTFDIIISTSTLDHFYSLKDFILSLNEIKRVIKKSGDVFLYLNNKNNINFRIMAVISRKLKITNYPIQFFSKEEILSIFDKLGLKINSIDNVVHIISPFNSILILLRKIFSERFVDKLALHYIKIDKLFSKNIWLKNITSWFWAIHCQKYEE